MPAYATLNGEIAGCSEGGWSAGFSLVNLPIGHLAKALNQAKAFQITTPRDIDGLSNSLIPSFPNETEMLTHSATTGASLLFVVEFREDFFAGMKAQKCASRA